VTGSVLFLSVKPSMAERSEEHKSLLRKVVQAFNNPRINKADDESALKDVYGIMSLLMNPTMKADRVKLFINKQKKHCFGSSNPKEAPIQTLNFRGKAKLHLSCLSDTLTIAQEAWILLHLARCYYYHFEETIAKEALPVTPQALSPGVGTSQSYSLKDVRFFRDIYKKIQTARKLEDTALAEGIIDKEGRYCHWDFEAEFDDYNRELARNGEEELPDEDEPDPLDEFQDEIDDDSLDGVDEFEI